MKAVKPDTKIRTRTKGTRDHRNVLMDIDAPQIGCPARARKLMQTQGRLVTWEGPASRQCGESDDLTPNAKSNGCSKCRWNGCSQRLDTSTSTQWTGVKDTGPSAK
jgi:hypothetical protein